jgi:hypothetical protein
MKALSFESRDLKASLSVRYYLSRVFLKRLLRYS